MIKLRGKSILVIMFVLTALSLALYPATGIAAKAQNGTPVAKADPSDKLSKANAAFDADKMGNMSDFDPATWVPPTGDTIKIGILASFSGPAAVMGNFYYGMLCWAAYDINKRGGIWVDGKKKMIELIKGDTMGKVDQAKKVAERLVLQDKVHVLWGPDGSHIMKVVSEVANKYKVILLNATNSADEIMSASNFGRYTFHGCISTDQIARGLAYYYGKIRKQEKKFYIICQDYGFGHDFADGFKKGLKQYYPEAQIVGEDYHKLFLTDFAPYLAKIKAAGAEVIFTGNWGPDASILAKQTRQMGINLPFAHIWMTDANMLNEIGIEGTKGWVHVGPYHSPVPFSAAAGYTKLYKSWTDQWNTWKTSPFNSPAFRHGPAAVGGSWMMQAYWLLSVIERAKTTNADKIVQVWEGDTYRQANGKVIKMRVCDHKAIQDLSAEVYLPPDQQKKTFTIPPYHWFEKASYVGEVHRLPAANVLPWMDQKLDRCSGKNDWGE